MALMSDSKKNHRGLEPEVTEKLQRQAAELAESVDAGDYAKAMTLINELSEVRDQSLYREVGRLTRSLHEAIRNFQIDPRNAEQQEALSKMTDASDRLEYVVQMTGEAANRTMDLVEETMPVANALRDEAAALRDALKIKNVEVRIPYIRSWDVLIQYLMTFHGLHFQQVLSILH